MLPHTHQAWLPSTLTELDTNLCCLNCLPHWLPSHHSLYSTMTASLVWSLAVWSPPTVTELQPRSFCSRVTASLVWSLANLCHFTSVGSPPPHRERLPPHFCTKETASLVWSLGDQCCLTPPPLWQAGPRIFCTRVTASLVWSLASLSARKNDFKTIWSMSPNALWYVSNAITQRCVVLPRSLSISFSSTITRFSFSSSRNAMKKSEKCCGGSKRWPLSQGWKYRWVPLYSNMDPNSRLIQTNGKWSKIFLSPMCLIPCLIQFQFIWIPAQSEANKSNFLKIKGINLNFVLLLLPFLVCHLLQFKPWFRLDVDLSCVNLPALFKIC